MAQYFQVLGQSDKLKDEEAQYYPVVEKQTVQYVIAHGSDQQFQTQSQIVMSADQLMVIEGQPRQVIVDQSHINYQPSQFIEQESGLEFQATSQQQTPQTVYYMESNSPNLLTEVNVTEATQPQPIVLNHQLNSQVTLMQHRPPLKTATNNSSHQMIHNQQAVRLPVQRTATPRPPRPQLTKLSHPVNKPLQQPTVVNNQSSSKQLNQQLMRASMQPQSVRMPNQILLRAQTPVQRTAVSLPQQFQKPPPQIDTTTHQNMDAKVSPVEYATRPEFKLDQVTENDKQEAISLSDGSIVSVAEYKEMLLTQQQQRLHVTPDNVSPTKRSRTSNRGRGRGGGGSGNRSNRGKNKTNRNVPSQFPVEEPNLQTLQTTQPPSLHLVGNKQQSPLHFGTNKQHPPLSYLSNKPQHADNRALHQSPQPNRNASPPHLQQQPMTLANHILHGQQQLPIRQSQNHYLIQPPKQQSKPQQQRPLPSYIPSSQIQQIIENTPISEEYSDSIRMLVLLSNGEQRLITFTLPKEACTIQEILEQVGVPLQHDTNIEVTEANTNGINYIVTVGQVSPFSTASNSQTDSIMEPEDNLSQCRSQSSISDSSQILRELSPEPTKEQPKYIPGKLAVCSYCGYLSENLTNCLRCKTKLPEGVKVMSTSASNGKKNDMKEFFREKKELAALQQATKMLQTSQPLQSNGAKDSSPQTISKKKTKQKISDNEPLILTLSSDEEVEEPAKTSKALSEVLLQKLGSQITLSPIKKEPSMSDIQKNAPDSVSGDPKQILEKSNENRKSASIYCRTVRIGSYRFVPTEDVIVDSEALTIKVPHPKNEKEITTISVERNDMVKVLVSFQKQLPVVFYYLRPYVGSMIRNTLGMVKDTDHYFDPLSNNESHRRITLLPELMPEETKTILQQIYTAPPHSILDELTSKEANDILIKTCPKELTQSTLNSIGLFTEVKHILTYPPEGRGRISINTEDYMCLGSDQFLNDVIIDFYLKYLVHNLSMEEQDKVHVFSTFFYKRLTTKPVKASRKSQPAELDPTLTPAEKRHARVKTWTKNINLFEKDFIIVPINENCHWFLAIICFPGMEGCQTVEGQPIKLEIKPKTKKKAPNTTTIGNVTITSIKKEPEPSLPCEDGESDKDEAEGDESELESDDDSDETPPAPTSPTIITSHSDRPPIKQPCILIFDSLAGASRSRVVATLRDYLTCEYKAKTNKEKVYNKDIIKGACPKVPQQTNFTDCGLYLLQYVEHFFMEPIKDYYIPINQLKNWFDEITVTRKREDICILIKALMDEYGKDVGLLPDIILPTKHGVLTDFLGDDDEMEDEEMTDDDEFSNPPIGSETEVETTTPEGETLSTVEKPSCESVTDRDNIVEQTITNVSLLKPDISEFPRQSDRKTLSYLKAKRIIRNKFNDEPDMKKHKSSE